MTVSHPPQTMRRLTEADLPDDPVLVIPVHGPARIEPDSPGLRRTLTVTLTPMYMVTVKSDGSQQCVVWFGAADIIPNRRAEDAVAAVSGVHMRLWGTVAFFGLGLADIVAVHGALI